MAVPALKPFTLPYNEFGNDATAVFEELQVPPVTAFVNSRFDPTHTWSAPVIVPATGAADTAMLRPALTVPQPFE